MNSIPLCQWRTSFASVLFETDQVRFKSRIAEASWSIDQRLLSVREIGSVERVSLEMAQRSLAAMEREPYFVPRPRREKTVISARSIGADADVKRTEHGIGSHVRVTLPSGEMASAEIVVIFTASSRKNILVSFDKRFMRIGPEQILDCMSAKA
jgi:DNA-binding transcriptional regulator YhcF (GntR family)